MTGHPRKPAGEAEIGALLKRLSDKLGCTPDQLRFLFTPNEVLRRERELQIPDRRESVE